MIIDFISIDNAQEKIKIRSPFLQYKEDNISTDAIEQSIICSFSYTELRDYKESKALSELNYNPEMPNDYSKVIFSFILFICIYIR